MDMSPSSMNALLGQAQSQSTDRQIDSLMNRTPGTDEEARQVAEEFEAVFLTTMLETMFSGIKTDGLFGGGQSESMYRSMMNQEYAKSIARSGGLGIADQVYAQILKMQEGNNPVSENLQTQPNEGD